jgi:hypothetical protein
MGKIEEKDPGALDLTGWMIIIHMFGVEVNSLKIARYIKSTTTFLNILIVGCQKPRIFKLLTCMTR